MANHPREPKLSTLPWCMSPCRTTMSRSLASKFDAVVAAIWKIPPLRLSRSPESFKPLRERTQYRGRPISRCMELCQHRADHATGLVIPALASNIRQRRIVLGALHEDRVFPLRQYACRSMHVPPHPHHVANPLLVRGC